MDRKKNSVDVDMRDGRLNDEHQQLNHKVSDAAFNYMGSRQEHGP